MQFKKHYVLTPRNEGQEMNCRVKIHCVQTEAYTVAMKMAGEIQAALLMQGDVSVGIQTDSEALRGEISVFARWDGKIVDNAGNEVKEQEACLQS